MQKVKFIIKSMILACLMFLAVKMVTDILKPKDISGWPNTKTYNGFYELPKESLDCIMLDSSHAVSFFKPQELYEKYGFTGYNLGCEQQNLLTSYYWLEEALSYQKPQVVFLESFFFFPYTLGEESEIVNFDEPSLRKAFDYMRLSANKYRAIRDICRIDSSQTVSSYLFPLLRYHTRWNALTEEDFNYLISDKNFEDKGYYLIDAVSNYEYLGYDTLPEGEEKISDRDFFYLEKIRTLCQKEGINFVIVTTPKNGWNVNMHTIVSEYCNKNQLEYIDFCDRELMQKIGYCFATDNADYGHGNVIGARKITDYLGKYLEEY